MGERQEPDLNFLCAEVYSQKPPPRFCRRCRCSRFSLPRRYSGWFLWLVYIRKFAYRVPHSTCLCFTLDRWSRLGVRASPLADGERLETTTHRSSRQEEGIASSTMQQFTLRCEPVDNLADCWSWEMKSLSAIQQGSNVSWPAKQKGRKALLLKLVGTFHARDHKKRQMVPIHTSIIWYQFKAMNGNIHS